MHIEKHLTIKRCFFYFCVRRLTPKKGICFVRLLRGTPTRARQPARRANRRDTRQRNDVSWLQRANSHYANVFAIPCNTTCIFRRAAPSLSSMSVLSTCRGWSNSFLREPCSARSNAATSPNCNVLLDVDAFLCSFLGSQNT